MEKEFFSEKKLLSMENEFLLRRKLNGNSIMTVVL